ncbi:MAG TPA: hypothetical protein VK926_00470 [Gaiellaceae bacterium]|nr:hypothetical protein [Gaiellaceae bacterium]
MTGFRLRVPSDLRIVSAHGPDGWRAFVRETEATWSGGSLPPAAEATFHVELEAPSEPGPAVLETEQLYSGGEIVRWSVPLTVVPAEDARGQHLGRALAVALVGVLVAVAVAVLAWHRRTRSLQER